MAAGLSAENLNKILDLLTKAEQGSIVQAISELHKYLLEEKLAFKMKLQCDMIGVHFQNRDGIGCSATHVSDLITNIAAIGFVESEVKAICIEVPPDARGDRIREFSPAIISFSWHCRAWLACRSLAGLGSRVFSFQVASCKGP